MAIEKLNECLSIFYIAVRWEDGTEFKVQAIGRDAFFRFIPNQIFLQVEFSN